MMALLTPPLSLASGPAASPALCAPKQQVVFHCSVGTKVVSLCADTEGTQITAIDYRYGTPQRTELRWQATAVNGRHFSASTTALPGASVQQMWFDNAGVRYLLTQCIGGSCPHAAGLAVLREQRLVFKRRCLATPDDRAWFSPKLGQFGEDAASSRSKTPLLVFDDVDNRVEQLYSQR